MNKKKKLTSLTIIPVILQAIAFLFLPAQIPIHYNMNFQVTGYGSKFMLLILGVFVLIFGIFINILYKSNENTKQENIIYILGVIALIIFNAINILSLIGAFVLL